MNDLLGGSIKFNHYPWQNEFFKIFDYFPSNKKVGAPKEDVTCTYTEEDDDIYWTTEGDTKILEIMMPGYSKNEVNVKTNGKEIKIEWGWIDSKEEYTGLEDINSYTFDIPHCYEIPDSVTVEHGILTMEFKKKEKEDGKSFNILVK